MTAVREAVALPLIFLTVVLLGGLRLADGARFVPPSLFALVLAMLLTAALVQSGTLAAERLLGPARPMLANLNGLAALLTAFLATAQVFTLVTPESGAPALVFSLFFLVMLVQMLATGLDRPRLLRATMVTLGAAFVLKFVVLAALSAPSEGIAVRALQLLFEGVTLGTVSQNTLSPAAGYLAFVTLLLYLAGLALLPSAGWTIVRSAPRVIGDAGDALHLKR